MRNEQDAQFEAEEEQALQLNNTISKEEKAKLKKKQQLLEAIQQLVAPSHGDAKEKALLRDQQRNYNLNSYHNKQKQVSPKFSPKQQKEVYSGVSNENLSKKQKQQSSYEEQHQGMKAVPTKAEIRRRDPVRNRRQEKKRKDDDKPWRKPNKERDKSAQAEQKAREEERKAAEEEQERERKNVENEVSEKVTEQKVKERQDMKDVIEKMEKEKIYELFVCLLTLRAPANGPSPEKL
ncbi:MAG: hypothetical protein EZS28_012211 [Streblomastix strix]|uniref:Uncharacterized protein n=1 Tax=Streblomastix strix TaxID=222440 RepID=A0A5J4WCH5_9EUKA|nr:MAG: hypothetical protein EZS28_012211 [Streblomastix strix]